MARSPKPKADELLTLVTNVRFGGELFQEGWNFLPGDPLVEARPELFASFAGGHREIIRVREELDRIEREEDLRRRAEAAPPAPPAQPSRVVATRRLPNPGVGMVEPGTIFRASDQLVELAPDAFVPVQDWKIRVPMAQPGSADTPDVQGRAGGDFLLLPSLLCASGN